jgi:peptide chain release factor 3
VFYPLLGSQQILGVVGALQLDVLQSRLQQEYGVVVRYEPVSVVAVRWIETDDAATQRRFVERHRGRVAKDRDAALVYLPESQWALEQVAKDWPELSFMSLRERG